MQPSLFAARVDGLLAQVGTFLGDLVQAPSGDGHQLLDQQLHQFWHSFYELKKRSHDDELSVAVLALAKSGKPEDSRRSRCCPPRIAQGNARGEGLACNEGNARGPAARGAAVKRARSACRALLQRAATASPTTGSSAARNPLRCPCHAVSSASVSSPANAAR